MKTMWLPQTAMIVLLLLAGCNKWDEVVPSVEKEPSHRIPAIDSVGESGNLGKCSVSIESVYCWRDWQPIVEKPGKDGGSPLYVKTNIHVDNSTGSATKLSWNAYAFEVTTGKYHPIELLDKNGTPKWHGEVGDSEVRTAELMTHDGPYLNVGSRIILVFRVEGQRGQTLWVKSKESIIERTD
jgi:hypothetical protein